MRRWSWLAATLLVTFSAQAASLEWPQFGGPHRDFTSHTTGLANSWPSSGPKKLWSRELGDGYSGIVVDGPILYTMYRRGNHEITLAAAAATGKTIWEHAESAAFHIDTGGYGSGPHATPLVTANAVYAVGTLANLLCL